MKIYVLIYVLLMAFMPWIVYFIFEELSGSDIELKLIGAQLGVLISPFISFVVVDGLIGHKL